MVRFMEPDPAVRREIEHALRSYCRGIDRLDPESVLAAFHPGAELIDYRPDPMTIETFTSYIIGALEERFQATQHRLSNTTIDLDPGFDPGLGSGLDSGRDSGRDAATGQALVESYVLAFHLEAGGPGGPDRLHTFNGRYIDRFESRGGPWLIAERTLRVDWSRIEDVTETMGGAWVASGRAGSPDPFDR